MTDSQVTLNVEDQVFTAPRDLLCEHSDYFRAMFSGNYIEQERQEISINVVDANSMKIILQYMERGLIDITEFTLHTIGQLAVAANFLQITELVKQIEYCLDIQLSPSNWVEIMTIAENAPFSKLEQLCAAYGLFSFKSMKPEYIPTMQKLSWYLSHPYLDTGSELDVFEFGMQWMLHTETGADALLILLGCLDMTKLSSAEVEVMKTLTADYVNSLADKVIDCLHTLTRDFELTVESITANKIKISEMFTERVNSEVLSLVKESITRKLEYTPVIPMWIFENNKPSIMQSGMLYTFKKDTGFTEWLEVTEKDIWGWSIVSWGATKIVVVCGERGRGTGMFVRDVKIYDVLRKEWTRHGVQLPPRRHGGIAVVGDSLFLIGGVGGFRVVLDTAVIYDLKQRSFRKIAKLPDAIQNPAVCAHHDTVYAAGHKNIYKYEDLGDTDRWVTSVTTDIRINCMVLFKKYIYCTQNYFTQLYRFRPGIDNSLELVTIFSNPPSALCNLGDRLIVFTSTTRNSSDVSEVLSVEMYTGSQTGETPEVIWSQKETPFVVNDVAGSGALIMTMPPVNLGTSQYHKRYLNKYSYANYDRNIIFPSPKLLIFAFFQLVRAGISNSRKGLFYLACRVGLYSVIDSLILS